MYVFHAVSKCNLVNMTAYIFVTPCPVLCSFPRRIFCLTSRNLLSNFGIFALDNTITARRALTSRMEVTAIMYGVGLRVYRIRSRGQPTMGCLPAWELVEGLIPPRHKNQNVKMYAGPRS